MLRYAVLLGRVLSSRALKVLLYLWGLAWAFDRAIFWATEAAWFGSVGQGAWFGSRFGAQAGLFWGTLAVALISAALVMRIAARPAFGAELGAHTRKLPAALERLEPIRRNATRLAWLALVVGAWLVARQMAGGWAIVLGARAGEIANPVYGLPLARLLANCVWEWSLFLLGALAFAGVLRALPLLAAREPSPPLRLWRALGFVGVLVLLTRGALYGLSWAEANWSDGTTGAELFIGLPLAIVGIALCLLAAFWSLRRPGYRKLGVAAVLALFAPHFLRVLLAPLALIVPTPAPIETRNRAATAAGWGLNSVAPIAANAPPLVAHWPIWNEAALLGLALGEHNFVNQQVIDWKRATILLAQPVGPLTAIVAGVPASLENMGSQHDADARNGIEWLAFDATQSVEKKAPRLLNAALPLSSFYGIGGRALLGNSATKGGVPFGGWGWKFAWAWRLRDPLLMLEGARAQKLLVFRGARESVERLAPFLTWDEAQLRMTMLGPRWEMVGYASTKYDRGALAANESAFAGENSVAPAVVVWLDPRSGNVEFYNESRQSWAAPWAKILRASGSTEVETPLLESARAVVARQLGLKNALAETVWTWRDGKGQNVRYAPNLPTGIDEKLALLDSAARRDWPRIDRAKMEMGDALLWPSASAPGGFLVGRPYYEMKRAPGATTRGALAYSAKLWRVSLTGLANSPVAHGENSAAALINFDLQNAPPATVPADVAALPGQTPVAGATGVPLSKKQLILQALRANEAAEKAFKASNFVEWAKQSARQKELLEQLYQMPDNG